MGEESRKTAERRNMRSKYLPPDLSVRETVESGYKRIAFGDISDAVRLAFCDEEDANRDFSGLDLFSVAELKRPRGGGIEIKFYDRVKALQCLAEMESGEKSDTSFFETLEKSAKLLNHEGDLPDEA